MRNNPSLSLVEREVRKSICARCPRRTPGTDNLGPTERRACEESCPVFEMLPRLKKVAAGVDPMVGSRRRVLSLYLDRLTNRRRPADAPLRMHARPLVAVLDRVADT